MQTQDMLSQMASKPGFIAALDQSGGSTPGALRAYGIPETAYDTDDDMFRLMHEMRVRIMTAPAFTGNAVIAAILFEGTMDGKVHGTPVPTYLWQQRGIVPFVKVDKGLQSEADGVSLMKPIPDLDSLLSRAGDLGVYGTKMRSTIAAASRTGTAAIVAQQFELAGRISAHGLMPILEPEVLIKSPEKPQAEASLLGALQEQLDRLPAGKQVMLKLTLPDQPNLYAPLIHHPGVQRVVALSGGYSRDEACRRLTLNDGMIASFSRALLDDLQQSMTDHEFGAALAEAIREFYEASTKKA